MRFFLLDVGACVTPWTKPCHHCRDLQRVPPRESLLSALYAVCWFGQSSRALSTFSLSHCSLLHSPSACKLSWLWQKWGAWPLTLYLLLLLESQSTLMCVLKNPEKQLLLFLLLVSLFRVRCWPQSRVRDQTRGQVHSMLSVTSFPPRKVLLPHRHVPSSLCWGVYRYHQPHTQNYWLFSRRSHNPPTTYPQVFSTQAFPQTRVLNERMWDTIS